VACRGPGCHSKYRVSVSFIKKKGRWSVQPEVGGKKMVKKKIKIKIKIKGLGDDMENQPKREVAEGWVVSPRVVAALVSRVASDGRAGLCFTLMGGVVGVG